MPLSTTFQENLLLLRRSNGEKAAQLAEIPLRLPSGRQEIKGEWLPPAKIAPLATLFVYGINPLGEEYLSLKRWLQENTSRTLIFLVDDTTTARAFMETSVATELLKNPQVIFKLFHWPADQEWGDFRREFEWFFKTFAVGKFSFTTRAGAPPQEIERAHLLNRQFQRNIDDWLRTYHNYMIGQKEAFESYYPNLLELLNAKHGQAMAGTFKDVPAIICGAGPSLKQHLEKLRLLQDRALIFGSGSGLNVLSRHGIIPHFAGGVDTTPTQVSRLSTNFAFQVPFFYLNRFNHDALRFVQGDKLVARGGIRLHAIDWFDAQLGMDSYPRIRSGMSTSNFCFEVASFLGCSPIILVGMDLSYKGAVRYAPGVTAHPAEEQKHHADIDAKKANLVTVKGLDGTDVTTSWDWLLEAECFSESFKEQPGLEAWNATEGGMPIYGIPNIRFQEAIDKYMQTTYDFDALIHLGIQQHDLDFITRDKLQGMFVRWRDSLIHCKAVLSGRQEMLEKALEQPIAEGDAPPGGFFDEDLGALLGDSPAYTHALQQINDIFNGINGREFYRMAHYPEAYPPWKCAEASGIIETERCKFLIERLDYHLSKTEMMLAALPSYSMVPRSPHPKGHASVKREGDTVRYTYATGEPYAVKRFSNGRPHGLQEYFFVDGSPRTTLNYSEGFLDGEVRLYYPGNRQKRQLHFSKGQLSGTERLWNEEGTLIYEVEYRDNLPTGRARSWHPDGRLAREAAFNEKGEEVERVEY